MKRSSSYCKFQSLQECEKMLLFDLVLKLNPVLYLPGDYICVKVKLQATLGLVYLTLSY